MKFKTDLLEPDLEASIQDGDKRHRLLTRALRDRKEVGLVLSSKELLGSMRVGLEELLDECRWLVENGVRLDDGGLGSVVNTREPLLNATQPVTSEVAKRHVDPALLMRDIHEADHTKDNFLVGHVGKILDDATILLPSKPRLVEVLVELGDDLRTTLSEPRSALLFREFEDGVIELLPELDTTRSDLVDGLAELGANSEDATGLLNVSALPLSITNTTRGHDEVLDR